MKDVNAVVAKADVHFYPELSASQIELTLNCQHGRFVFRTPMDNDSMLGIMNLFGKDSIHELDGQYCRMLVDEETGRLDGIRNIIYDEMGELQDSPIF